MRKRAKARTLILIMIVLLAVLGCGKETVNQPVGDDGGDGPLGWTLHYSQPSVSLLSAVCGTSGSDIYAVGSGGAVLYYNGTGWRDMPTGTSENLLGVWGKRGDFRTAVATSPDIKIKSVGAQVSPGSHDVVITTPAEHAYVDALIAQKAPLARNERLTINGVTLPLMAGMNITMVRDLINQFSDATKATATLVAPDNRLRVMGEGYGSASELTVISEIEAAENSTGFGTQLRAGYGRDIAGTLGGHPADGSGMQLIGRAGTPVGGLIIETTALGNVGAVIITHKTHDFRAVGSRGTVRWFDGESWTASTSGVTRHLYDVRGTTETNVFAVGEAGTIIHYDGPRSDGTSWTQQISGTVNDLYGVWPGPGGEAIAVGEAGAVLRYAAFRWSVMTSGLASDLHGVWGTSLSDVFAVGANGTIAHFDGIRWSPMTSGTHNALIGIWGTSSSDLFAVGDKGTILHYDGVEWTLMESNTTVNLRGVWGTSGTNVFAVGEDGSVFRFGG